MRLPYLREGVEDELRLDPETEALAIVGARRVQAGELAQALEPIGDRVAVRRDRRRRGVHVRAVGQVGAEGADEVGAVVGVVGERRADARVAQAPQRRRGR